jgi:hypothetical protein
MNGFWTFCDSFYVKTGTDRFEERCRERNVYKIPCAALTLQLPSMRAVANAMAADDRLGPLYGKWVGVGGNLLNITAPTFADKCRVADYEFDNPAQLYEPDARPIEAFLRGLDHTLGRGELELEALVPLWDLFSPTPIELEHGLIIDRLSDEDSLNALRFRAIVGDAASHSYYDRNPGNDLCLRKRWSSPLEVLDRLPVGEELIEWANAATPFDEPDLLLDVFGLVAPGRYRPGTVLTKTTSIPWSFVGKMYYPWSSPALEDGTRFADPLRLDQEAVRTLIQFWSALKAQPAKGSNEVALRRLRLAKERRDLDDQLVDIVIACEALFIPENEDHGELTFRTALHAAVYLANDLQERKDIFHVVQAAYAIRSKIVHGARSRRAVVAGTEYAVSDILPSIERLVRRALVKRLEGGEVTIDWTLRLVGQR